LLAWHSGCSIWSRPSPPDGRSTQHLKRVIKASDAFKDNFTLLGPLSEPVPALSQERQEADPKLVSDQLFNDLQSSVYEGSAVVFFVEAI
jgi:hypothetical protein